MEVVLRSPEHTENGTKCMSHSTGDSQRRLTVDREVEVEQRSAQGKNQSHRSVEKYTIYEKKERNLLYSGSFELL